MAKEYSIKFVDKDGDEQVRHFTGSSDDLAQRLREVEKEGFAVLLAELLKISVRQRLLLLKAVMGRLVMIKR